MPDAAAPSSRPLLIAIDGRSASGKTTLTSALSAALPDTAVIHTDDICWNEPLFAWQHLLRDILTTLRRDGSLDYIPRPGPATTAPAGSPSRPATAPS